MHHSSMWSSCGVSRDDIMISSSMSPSLPRLYVLFVIRTKRAGHTSASSCGFISKRRILLLNVHLIIQASQKMGQLKQTLACRFLFVCSICDAL